MIYFVAPTCVLIKPNGKELEAFGYEAQERYSDEELFSHCYYFFNRFKMRLWKEVS